VSCGAEILLCKPHYKRGKTEYLRLNILKRQSKEQQQPQKNYTKHKAKGDTSCGVHIIDHLNF